MEHIYIGIAIITLLIIALFLSRRKGEQLRKPSNLVMLAMAFVVLGIIFGNTDRLIGYSFIGIGVLLSITDIIRKRQST